MRIHPDLVKDFNINPQYTLQGVLSSGTIDRSFVVSEIGERNEVDPVVDCKLE